MKHRITIPRGKLRTALCTVCKTKTAGLDRQQTQAFTDRHLVGCRPSSIWSWTSDEEDPFP